MSQLILYKVQQYLSSLQDGTASILDERVLEAFIDSASRTVKKQLSPDEDRDFRIRMSNLGRPGCVLQAEKLGVKREPAPYSARFRNLYGDIIEAASIAVMKNAGVRVIGEQIPTQLKIADATIDGTADVLIDEEGLKVYDVKSASNYAFENKYKDKTLQALWSEGDNFGYVTQIYLYSEALGVPAGGLIVVNKENGEWCLVQPPILDEELRQQALDKAAKNIRLINSDAPFTREFSEIEETYRGKPTGNTVLNSQCSFCPFKEHCWPAATYRPQIVSKGKSPKYVWYVSIDGNYVDNAIQE